MRRAPLAVAIGAADLEAMGAQRLAGHEDDRGLARSQHCGDGFDPFLRYPGRFGHRRHAGRTIGFLPGRVGRQDQGRHLPRPRRCRHHRLGTVGGNASRVPGGAHPRRHRPGNALHVGRERRVVLHVVGGVIADDINHRRVRLACVVQIGEPVAEPRAEMQKRRSRLVFHAPVAVGGAGDHALEQPQHAAHPGHAIQSGDEVHLGGAGVGEAHLDPGVDQGSNQAFSAVHCFSSSSVAPQSRDYARRVLHASIVRQNGG